MSFRRPSPVFQPLPNTATTFDPIVDCLGPSGTAGYDMTLPDRQKLLAIQRYNPTSGGAFETIYDLQDTIDGTYALPAFDAGRTLVCWGRGHDEVVYYVPSNTEYGYWTNAARIASGIGNSAVGDLTKTLVPDNEQHTKFIKIMFLDGADTMPDSARRV